MAWLSGEAGLAAELPDFVSSQTCRDCHAAESQAWSGSHHRWALTTPTPETVLGDFTDASLHHKGLTSRFFEKDGRYFVETDGADGKLATFEIKYVVGITPLQQYLVELEGRRLQALDLAWDVGNGRWFHLYPTDDVGAGNGLHWTGAYKNWQARCAVCHQTNFRKNYEPATHGYGSQWSELTVGCEACHGPGEAHVAWAGKRAEFDPAVASQISMSADCCVPRQRAGRTSNRTCAAPCHSRREAIGPDSTPPGGMFDDHYNLMPLANGLYFPDGQQRDEVYVLGSFLQSKMHAEGVTCTNCHEPHGGQLVADGNAVCTQCHNEVGRPDFPSLKPASYDLPDHHHHLADSAGAQCVSCHMPERNYMVVDGRRDHFFRVPDPLLSEKVGSPDACRSCHSAQTATWAADQIKQWAPDRSTPEARFAETLAVVQREGLSQKALNDLFAIAADRSRSAISRASAVREIGDQADPVTAAALAQLLSDDSALIRATAARVRRSSPATDRVDRLQPLLTDPVAIVRIAAALELSNIASDELPVGRRTALRNGIG